MEGQEMELDAAEGKSFQKEVRALSRGWALEDHRGSRVKIKLVVDRVEVAGQWGI